MFKRLIYDKLVEWKEQSFSTALIVTGARQIGKTTIIEEFGKKCFKSFYEINFVNDPGAKDIFSGKLDADILLDLLQAHLHVKFDYGQTLLFLDELQECPQARTALKFLVADNRIKVICSGSLLGINEKNYVSLPVGFEQELRMYPLNFYEFCLATNVGKTILDNLYQSYINLKPIDENIHKLMCQKIYEYVLVGGMPKTVDIFINNKNKFNDISNYQNQILRMYRMDITKYSSDKERNIIKLIYDTVPSNMIGSVRRFVLSEKNEENSIKYRLDRNTNSFLWLLDAGVCLASYNISEPKLPLKLNSKMNLFKLFFNDVGLLTSALNSISKDLQFYLYKKSLNIDNEYYQEDKFKLNLGPIFENFIAQELASNNFFLYYFNSKKYGEVDFVIETNNRFTNPEKSFVANTVLPIEVKSRTTYLSHKAMDNILNSDEFKISNGIVFSFANIKKENKTIYLPLYLAMFLKDENL